MNKTVISMWEKERKTIYMGCIRACLLKRSCVRLSAHPEDLPLAIEELPRVPYLLKIDELRSSEL